MNSKESERNTIALKRGFGEVLADRCKTLTTGESFMNEAVLDWETWRGGES